MGVVDLGCSSLLQVRLPNYSTQALQIGKATWSIWKARQNTAQAYSSRLYWEYLWLFCANEHAAIPVASPLYVGQWAAGDGDMSAADTWWPRAPSI